MQKSIAFISINNNSLEEIMDKKILFSEAMKMINYLGINKNYSKPI